jgi:N-methylhydantoinase A
VAERLDIPRVLVPRYPGVLCAFGLLAADVALDYSRSVLGVVNEDTPARLSALLDGMIQQARADLYNEGIDEGSMVFTPLVDMRYQGQAYELTVPYEPRRGEACLALTDLTDAFHDAHRSTYGHAMPTRLVEVVNLRLQAVGMVEKPVLEKEPVGAQRASPLLGHKTTADGQTLALYERDSLPPSATFRGPALVFQMDSTVYIAPGWSARVDGYRNLVMQYEG